MIRLEDLLNFLFPGLDVGFIYLLIVILFVYGIVEFFKGKTKVQTDSNIESNDKPARDSFYEYNKEGKIVAEVLPLELFLTNESKYISFQTETVPKKDTKVVTDIKGYNKIDYSHIIAHKKPTDYGKLLGYKSSEGVLHTTYKGKEIWIDSYIKNVTIENLRQHKDKYVVCASTGVITGYTLKYKEDVVNSSYIYNNQYKRLWP